MNDIHTGKSKYTNKVCSYEHHRGKSPFLYPNKEDTLNAMVFGGTGKREGQQQTDALWSAFARQENLEKHQLNQFKVYADLLIEWNKKINLTRITDLDDIIAYHFQDSLHVRNFVDLNRSTGIVDVGTGAGFPGVPLAIVFPELPVVLVEVNQKKIAFLHELIKRVSLEHVSVYGLDWRIFLRTTDYPADYIFARASLSPEELVRALRPSSFYHHATIVYWASQHWVCTSTIKPFFKKEEKYAIKEKKRRFIFLGRPKPD